MTKKIDPPHDMVLITRLILGLLTKLPVKRLKNNTITNGLYMYS